MKIGPYNPVISGLSKYESLCLLTKQESDPSIDRDRMVEERKNVRVDLKSVDFVIKTPLKRGAQTLDYLIEHDSMNKDVIVEVNGDLTEVRFDMRTLCTNEEYGLFGSTIVRERFLTAFIQDGLLESRKDLAERMNRLQKQLSLLGQFHHILCLSHTFFIKLFCIYREYPILFDDPELIKKQIDPTKRLMESCETIKF